MSAATSTTKRFDLERVLNPHSVAIVGLKDDSPMVKYVKRTLESDANVYFVNPNYDSVLGRPTFKTLADIPEPIDVVYCAVGAPVTTAIAEQAADLGNVGGLVMIAGGFAEAGEAGHALQDRIVAAAARGGFAVVGPNGLGIKNVPRDISLTIASDHKRRSGGISIASQSGAIVSGIAMAAWERPSLGLNVLVSAGNEAVTDLADYLDYFVDDPATTAIGLVIEKIRRPTEFFAAARRALEAGKPIVALKLARSARTQALAASHTGSLTGDAWVYEVAFRQAGIAIARDPEELLDRLSIVEQLDPAYWTEVRGLAILTSTGGFASMTMDLATDEGLDPPALADFAPWLEQNIPGTTVANPLDIAGQADVWPAVLEQYGSSSEVDAAIFVQPLADEDGPRHVRMESFIAAAERYKKPFIVSNCATAVGEWARELIDPVPGAAVGRGPRQTLRGLYTLGQFVRARNRLGAAGRAPSPVARPAARTITEPEGAMLPFADAMNLLEKAGIPVAPYHLIPAKSEATVPTFAGPYVVKLADVGHRTEHGAVLLGITADGLPKAVADLRAIATRDGLESVIAVQPMVASRGEAFIGIQNGELGPMVVFGLGGVFVEVLKRIGGRMAPFDRTEAEALIAEFEDAKILHGFRGQPAWNLDRLADLLVCAGDLAAGSSEWLDSLDVNPLLVTDDGFLAVDALCIVRD